MLTYGESIKRTLFICGTKYIIMEFIAFNITLIHTGSFNIKILLTRFYVVYCFSLMGLFEK